jgi:nucleoside-diphosphate-sugar epimerase
VPSLHLDSSAAAERLGWVDRTPLEEGVRKTAEWLEALLKRGG